MKHVLKNLSFKWNQQKVHLGVDVEGRALGGRLGFLGSQLRDRGLHAGRLLQISRRLSAYGGAKEAALSRGRSWAEMSAVTGLS